MCLPTAKDINPFDDLDGQRAERHFLGKTLEEAEALFREDSLTYQEDLMFMGVAAFRFYVQAAIRYIQSESATGDSDIISCFAAIFESRLEYDADELTSVAKQLAWACAYVLQNYDKFDLTPEIYSDLRPKFRDLQRAFSQLVPVLDKPS
jgi:hypothetical protein